MHNINIIHRSFPPTALFPCLAGSFPFPCLALPVSLICLFPLHSACFLALPTFVPCLFPFPAYFHALPFSLPCLLPCRAYFCALPFPFPCLLMCPAYFLDLLIYFFFMSASCTGILLVLS